jgi:hypothetical protein
VSADLFRASAANRKCRDWGWAKTGGSRPPIVIVLDGRRQHRLAPGMAPPVTCPSTIAANLIGVPADGAEAESAGAHSPSVDLEVGGESLKAYPIHRTRQHGRYFRLPHCVSLFEPAFERLLQMYRNAFLRSFGATRP